MSDVMKLHRWVSTRHPEDDEPWCGDCGIPIDHPNWDQPCPKQQTQTERNTTS